jgi:hypothetical protein
MHLYMVAIGAAMLTTLITLVLGVLAMSGGGATDRTVSNPLMWARVGFQALTIILLVIAIRFH